MFYYSYEAYLESMEIPPTAAEINAERYWEEIRDAGREWQIDEDMRLAEEAERLGVTEADVLFAMEISKEQRAYDDRIKNHLNFVAWMDGDHDPLLF